MTDRCSVASLERDDPLAGTASTVRAFLLVEHPGPWGVEALRDARLPAGLGDELRARTTAAKVRPLLIRRPDPKHRRDRARRVRVFAGFAHHRDPWLETVELSSVRDLLALDLAAIGAGRSPGLDPVTAPVLAICTHGRHDVCCAVNGRPVARALAERHPELAWEVSHIGGDRFAANALALPWGLYYGRLDAESAAAVADALVDGDLELDHLRGRSGLAPPLQAAEIGLRQRLDERRMHAVHFRARVVDGELTEAQFAVGAAAPYAEYVVTVRSTRSEQSERLTCRAVRENPLMQHEVLGIRAR